MLFIWFVFVCFFLYCQCLPMLWVAGLHVLFRAMADLLWYVCKDLYVAFKFCWLYFYFGFVCLFFKKTNEISNCKITLFFFEKNKTSEICCYVLYNTCDNFSMSAKKLTTHLFFNVCVKQIKKNKNACDILYLLIIVKKKYQKK